MTDNKNIKTSTHTEKCRELRNTYSDQSYLSYRQGRNASFGLSLGPSQMLDPHTFVDGAVNVVGGSLAGILSVKNSVAAGVTKAQAQITGCKGASKWEPNM